MSYPDISIVILNYNGKKLLEKYFPSVLAACRKYSLEKTEIIVIDNASGDGSVEYLREKFPFIKLIIQPFNRYFYAVNGGIYSAKNRIVLSLNNDIELEPDFLFFIPQHFEDKEVFAVRPGIKVNPSDRIADLKDPRTGGAFRLGFFDIPRKSTGKNGLALFAGGGGCAFDKGKFMELGGFDKIFYPLYYEDSDLCYRAWKAGWKIVYEPRSLLYHQGGATTSKMYSNFRLDKIAERNRYIFVWKDIEDPALILQHLFFIPFRLLKVLLTGRFGCLVGFSLALKDLRKVMRLRKLQNKFNKRRDKEIFDIFKE